jgi:sugar O-acyltransferase (sialic acid O-acetyltransferase NeuD family)
MKAPEGKIVIFGCGGHSRSVADVLLSTNLGAELVFVDGSARDGEQILGFDVFREYRLGDEQVFLAIGDNAARKNKLGEIGVKHLICIISGTGHRGYGSTLEAGCFVGNFCHIGPETVIGKNTILNTASVIEHEVIIGAHCHIGPNATVSGRCNIGDLVFIGVGATVKDNISICANVMIGAGANIVKDIVEPGTYLGNPARRIE